MLLHNWQVLINCASLFNTNSLRDWFTEDTDCGMAFRELLKNGSFVVYLMFEKSPVEHPKFDIDEKQYETWQKICSEIPVYCIRMSWSDMDSGDDANRYAVAQNLTMRMMYLLLTTANNPYRLKAFRHAMHIDETDADCFTNVWCSIRRSVMEQDDRKHGSYTRNRFYQDYLIKQGTAVQDCILDFSKPFVRELKQIIDFRYMINLPLALHLLPMSSYEDNLWNYLAEEQRSTQQHRMITADELYCAVIMQKPDFLTDIFFTDQAKLDLADVVRIRESIEWISYMEALDASRKRSNRNEIDFHDVEVVWSRFRLLMNTCCQKLPDLELKLIPGSLSLIFSIGHCRLTAVYTAGSSKIELKKENTDLLSDCTRETLTIDFVCGNVLKCNPAENCFMEKLRLFEGILLQSSRTAFQRMMEALDSSSEGSIVS